MESTIIHEIMGPKYSSKKSLFNANFHPLIIPFVFLQPRISIFFLSKIVFILGRIFSAIFEETTSDSNVLQVPNLCVLALSTMEIAFSRSANSSI